MTRRNLVHISREPMQLSDVTIQPVLFTVLFIYIFGGGIPIPDGGSYKDFVLAGLLALNLVTSTMGTAVGLSTDLHEGMIDRFRTLPMWRAAVLVGRSIADLMTSMLCVVIVAITGLAVGWRTDASFFSVIGGFALVVFFAYSLSWIAACVGLNSKSPESAASFGFIVLFPLGIRLERHGPDSAHARLATGCRELESRQRGDCRRPASVGKSESVRHYSGLADAAPGGGRPYLVAF